MTFFEKLMGAVPEILKFGFIGLAVIMAILVTYIIVKAITQHRVDPEKNKLIRFCIVMIFIFMFGAGALQFGTDYIKKKVFVNIKITPWSKNYETKYGNLTVSRGTEDFPYEGKALVVNIGDDQDLNVNLLEVIDNRDLLQIEYEKCQSLLGDSLGKIVKKSEVGFSDAP